MEEAQRRAKALGARALPQADVVNLFKEKFPEQLKKQLRAIAHAANRDAPQPTKGNVRVMMTVDTRSLTPSQVGKQLAAVAQEQGLTTAVQQAQCNTQCFVASAKDASKAVVLEMRAVSCTHHKWAGAIWLDLDAAEAVDVEKLRLALLGRLVEGDASRCAFLKLPHSAMRAKLPTGLFVAIRNGKVNDGFGTRLELRQVRRSRGTATAAVPGGAALEQSLLG